MKMNPSGRLAFSFLFIMMQALPAISQSIRYNGEIEAGAVVTRKFAEAQFNAATTHGIFLSKPRLFFGVGGSIGWNIDAVQCNTVYPVYADIRKDFSINSSLTAFIDAKAGHTFEGSWTGILSEDRVNYGFYCYPAIGLRLATSKKCGIYLKLGYTYQAVTFSYNRCVDGATVTDSGNAGGFSATIGFSLL